MKSQKKVTPQYVWKLTPHNFCCNFSPLIRSLTIYTEAPARTKLKAIKIINETPASATCVNLKCPNFNKKKIKERNKKTYTELKLTPSSPNFNG